MEPEKAACSFCHKSSAEVGPLIEGPGEALFICGSCVDLCREILDQEAQRRQRLASTSPEPSTFQRLTQKLGLCWDVDTHTWSALLAAIDRHYVSLSQGTTPARSLILVAGPSRAAGLLATKLIASAMSSPFRQIDRRQLFQAPRWFDRESELFKILSSGEFDLEVVHRTIAYVDRLEERNVQESLSRMIHSGAEDQSLADMGLDLRRILFICSGAFAGLDDISKHSNSNIIDSSDLLAWGVLPELVERLHIALRWDALDEQALFRVASNAEIRLPVHGGDER